MPAKFNIVFNDGRETISNLSLLKAVDWKIAHMQELSLFSIVEQTGTKSPKEKKVENSEDLQSHREFLASLSEEVREQIKKGKRKVRKGTDGMYYTAQPELEEIRISLQKPSRESSLREAVLQITRAQEQQILADIDTYFPELEATTEEVESLIARLTIIIK